MLTPDQVRDLFHHDSEDVRELALSYFQAYQSRDPKLFPALLGLIEHSPKSESARQAAAQSAGAIADGDNILAALAFLAKEPSQEFKELIEKAIALAPPAAQAEKLEDIRAAKGFSKSALAAIEGRAALAIFPPEDLWLALSRRVEDLDFSGHTDNEADFEWIEDALDAIAPASIPSEDQLRSLLEDRHDDLRSALFLILVGLRRLHSFAPLLISELGEGEAEDDEEPIDTLARMPSPELVPLLTETYDTKDWAGRASIIQLLSAWKIPEAEAALIALFETEDDASLRTFLCLALTDLISREAYDLISAEIEAGYDRSIVRLEKRALAMAIIFELPPPTFELPKDEKTPIFDGGAPLILDLDGPPKTARRGGPKVGRNDPCPCGSGKKYKKCCGR